MNPKENPCYGCVAPKRHVGCHGTCKEYRKRTAERISEKVNINKQRVAEKYTSAQVKESYYGKVEYRTRKQRRTR